MAAKKKIKTSYVYIRGMTGDASASMAVYHLRPREIIEILAGALPKKALTKHEVKRVRKRKTA